MDIQQLSSKYEQVPGVYFEETTGGLPCVMIETEVCTGQMMLDGAHVTQWRPRDAEPVLFMSEKSYFEQGKPLRGGVPVIFPWFGPHASNSQLPAHGFVRTQRWQIASIENTDAGLAVTMLLTDTEQSRQLWPHEFALTFRATFGKTLQMALTVRNTTDAAFDFECALHTYFAVKDCRQVHITGLEGVTFLDKVDDAKRKQQGEKPITFTQETDRVYLNTQSTCVLHDIAMGRQIAIDKSGSDTTVVWNPWIDKAARMPDFGDDEWPHMVCIETANAAENRITLPGRQMHTTLAEIRMD